ncbi:MULTISPECIES: hypothetical protein [unclassified Marinovum]
MTGQVEVHGRDVATEAYRISTADGRALVPEYLMSGQTTGQSTGQATRQATGLRPNARPTHQEAYEWIARHNAALHRAVAQLARGTTPKPPFDTLTLIPSSV